MNKNYRKEREKSKSKKEKCEHKENNEIRKMSANGTKKGKK